MRKKSTHSTLNDVARKAGVGTTTVSRVINGGQNVNPETLAHVRRVIKALSYTPNQAARSLRGERTKTISLLIPSIADPFFASCAEVVQSIAQANDSLLIVTVTHNDAKREIENLNVLIRHRTDGLIIAPSNPQSAALSDLLKRVAIPAVSIDRPIAKSGIPSVVTDNYDGALRATQHLIGHGYKRILCLTGESDFYTIRERIRGYRKAVESAGLVSMVDTSIRDYKSAVLAIKALLKGPNPPDAIFTLKNSTTIYAFEVLQELNVKVPDAIALLGFDDLELATALRPAISVVQQPIEEIGRIATELLFNELRGSQKSRKTSTSKRPQKIEVKTRLELRHSCGCQSPTT